MLVEDTHKKQQHTYAHCSVMFVREFETNYIHMTSYLWAALTKKKKNHYRVKYLLYTCTIDSLIQCTHTLYCYTTVHMHMHPSEFGVLNVIIIIVSFRSLLLFLSIDKTARVGVHSVGWFNVLSTGSSWAFFIFSMLFVFFFASTSSYFLESSMFS